MTPKEVLEHFVIGKRSRKIQRDDLFVYRLQCEHVFRYGAVAYDDAVVGGCAGAILIYLYDMTSEAPQADVNVSKHGLLVPPLGVSRAPWVKGVFEKIGKVDPSVAFFDHHSISSFGTPTGYVNVDGSVCEDPRPPFVPIGLRGNKGVLTDIYEALGYEY